MRLICPNCGAQYEVSDDAIPAVGRDVQCSNCGHTWFENPATAHEDEELWEEPAPLEPETPEPQGVDVGPAEDERMSEPEAGPEPAPESEPEPAPEIEPEPAADPEPELEPETVAAEISKSDGAEPVVADDDDTLDESPQEQAELHPPRKELDASVAAILREEAELEERTRAQAASGIESQSDLGLDAATAQAEGQRQAESQDRMSRLRGQEAENAAAVAALAAESRRELLPDIEEINSTLRSSEERGDNIAPMPEEVEETKRRGFRFGFFSVLIIIAILWVLYLYAPQLYAAVPALEGPLTAYTDAVDSARLWVDLKAQDLLQTMEGGGTEASEANAN